MIIFAQAISVYLSQWVSVLQVSVVQPVSQVLDLVLQLSDQLVLGVVLYVHHGLVVDGLGGVCVLQGAEGLLEVGV